MSKVFEGFIEKLSEKSGYSYNFLIDRYNEKIINDTVASAVEESINVETGKIEEWIWIDGFKGTDSDMKCRDYQFRIGETFTVSDEKDVKLCEHGFHLCATLKDVFDYYPIGDNNRFFKVKALVRKEDYDSLGPMHITGPHSLQTYVGIKDKIAAKSIIFIEELSVDEILKNRVPKDWTDEQKNLAIRIGIKGVKEIIYVEKLVSVGYSETFARYCFENDFTDIALSVGSQEGLSMDMKVWAIFNSNKK